MPSVHANQIWDYVVPVDHDNGETHLPQDDIGRLLLHEATFSAI